jgi:hypothetical protein
MYWCILHYYKCKVEYIELGVMKVILIRVIISKKVINIVLKSEIGQLFYDNIFFTKNSVIMGRRE